MWSSISPVPGTVLDQITLGDPRISWEMAQNAARLAGLDATIDALPAAYDTPCSDGLFSQGEWQLLCIARAAAADPAVLLLDEITANLDAETEARVLEALRRASVGRTVLSISHRVYENLAAVSSRSKRWIGKRKTTVKPKNLTAVLYNGKSENRKSGDCGGHMAHDNPKNASRNRPGDI
ncbi:MAG: ATP-binding cassette domain-containing protein [Christensenellales bacterium]